jgi:hypothetical protein
MLNHIVFKIDSWHSNAWHKNAGRNEITETVYLEQPVLIEPWNIGKGVVRLDLPRIRRLWPVM